MPKPLTRLMLAMGELRKLDPDMPMPHAVAFLVIANNPAITQKRLAELLDIGKSTATRLFAKLSDQGVGGLPGLGLIDTRPGNDARETCAFVSKKGQRVLETLTQIIGG